MVPGSRAGGCGVASCPCANSPDKSEGHVHTVLPESPHHQLQVLVNLCCNLPIICIVLSGSNPFRTPNKPEIRLSLSIVSLSFMQGFVVVLIHVKLDGIPTCLRNFYFWLEFLNLMSFVGIVGLSGSDGFLMGVCGSFSF